MGTQEKQCGSVSTLHVQSAHHHHYSTYTKNKGQALTAYDIQLRTRLLGAPSYVFSPNISSGSGLLDSTHEAELVRLVSTHSN